MKRLIFIVGSFLFAIAVGFNHGQYAGSMTIEEKLSSFLGSQIAMNAALRNPKEKMLIIEYCNNHPNNKNIHEACNVARRF